MHAVMLKRRVLTKHGADTRTSPVQALQIHVDVVHGFDGEDGGLVALGFQPVGDPLACPAAVIVFDDD